MGLCLSDFLEGFGATYGKVQWGSAEVTQLVPVSLSLSFPQDKDSSNLVEGTGGAVFCDELSDML